MKPPWQCVYVIAAAQATGWPEEHLWAMPLSKMLLYVSTYAVTQGAELRYLHATRAGLSKLDNILHASHV